MNTMEVVDLLTDALERSGRSPNTINAYRSDVEHWMDWSQKCKPITTDTWHLVALEVAPYYITGIRGSMSINTLLRRMSSIRAVAKLVGAPDPFAGFSKPRQTRPPAHPLDAGLDGLTALRDAAPKLEGRCLVVLCGWLGLRISEARSVRVNDLGVRGGEHYITVRGKGDKERSVPVHPEALAIIQERISEVLSPSHSDKAHLANPRLISYSDRGARALLTRLGHQTGQRVASHDLRMTFGTLVHDASLNLRATQELLGHSSIETTVGYTRLGDRAKVSAVKGAFG
jgi:integrase/recombinase XerC